MKGRILISDLGSNIWRDIGVGTVTFNGPESEPGDAYYQATSGTIRSTTTDEYFRPCYFCSGRGRRKLRKRSRGKGRYGACPDCEGRGGRWTFFAGQHAPFSATIDELTLDRDMLNLFFNGGTKP